MVLKQNKKLNLTLSVLTSMCLLTSCYFKGNWTAEEKQRFETECLGRTTVEDLSIELKGFDDGDFDSISIQEFKNNIIIDSFKVAIRKSGTPDEKKNKIRFASIDRTFNLKHLYKFIIPGQEPYELTNMKMVVTDQYTMQGEGHGCHMDEYTIDGKHPEEGRTMTFVKKQ